MAGRMKINIFIIKTIEQVVKKLYIQGKVITTREGNQLFKKLGVTKCNIGGMKCTQT